MKFKRNIRVLLTHKDSEKKDKVYMRGNYQDNLNFYNNLQVLFGETLFLQYYINDNWITRYQRSSPGRGQEVNINE